jgi:hypothetical protein
MRRFPSGHIATVRDNRKAKVASGRDDSNLPLGERGSPPQSLGRFSARSTSRTSSDQNDFSLSVTILLKCRSNECHLQGHRIAEAAKRLS